MQARKQWSRRSSTQPVMQQKQQIMIKMLAAVCLGVEARAVGC